MPLSQEMDLEDFERFLEQRGAALQNLDASKPLRQVERLLAKDIAGNFQGAHDSEGNPWLPLKKPKTVRRFLVFKRNQKPLEGKGVLKNSVTKLSDPHHVGGVSGNRLTFGTDVPIAGVMQLGATVMIPAQKRGVGQKPLVFVLPNGATIFTRSTKAHEVKIPARPFLGWSRRLLEQTDEVLGDWMESMILGDA